MSRIEAILWEFETPVGRRGRLALMEDHDTNKLVLQEEHISDPEVCPECERPFEPEAEWKTKGEIELNRHTTIPKQFRTYP